MITDLQKQKAIFHHLQAFGIRHHCAGHRYLCTSITLALAHPEYLSEVMEQFYPAVAKNISDPSVPWKAPCAAPSSMPMNRV